MTYQRRRLASRAFERVARFVTRLQAWPQRLTPPAFRLLQIGSAFWQSRALHVAAKMDIATILGQRTLSAEELAKAVNGHPDSLYRLMRLLVAMGVFDEPTPRAFRNNTLSAALRSDQPGSVRAMVLMHNSPEMSEPWFTQLEDGIRGGTPPFQLAHGQTLFDYMDAHADFDAQFGSAMDSVDALSGDSFATEFNWGAFDRVIDVGGSKGAKSLAILRRHKSLTALVVDRAQIVEQAERYWREHADAAALQPALSRLSFVAGDVFTNIPAAESSRDVYLLSAVLHCFDDATAQRALQNVARQAGFAGATIAVLELVMPDRADIASASFDMQMLMGTRGRERTRDEWDALFAMSGVQREETVDLMSFGKIMVLRPIADS
ncbi:MAG: methyltransferase [Casimicrobium sp.]